MTGPDSVPPPTGRQARSPAANRRRSLLVTTWRFAGRCVFSLVLVTVALFPNTPRLAGQFSRALHPERLVDPFFPGSGEAVEKLELHLAVLPADASLADRVQAVGTFVKKRIAYAHDWDLYGGNLHDWPTPEEVWRRGRDDCDGIAVLNASLLQRLGIDATLEYNAFHCWVRVEGADDAPVTAGRAIAGPTVSRADGGTDWISLARDLLRQRTWEQGLSFPVWRILVALVVAILPWWRSLRRFFPFQLGLGRSESAREATF